MGVKGTQIEQNYCYSNLRKSLYSNLQIRVTGVSSKIWVNVALLLLDLDFVNQFAN